MTFACMLENNSSKSFSRFKRHLLLFHDDIWPLVSFCKHEMDGQEMPLKASHAVGGENVGRRVDTVRHFPKEVEFFLTLHKG